MLLDKNFSLLRNTRALMEQIENNDVCILQNISGMYLLIMNYIFIALNICSIIIGINHTHIHNTDYLHHGTC